MLGHEAVALQPAFAGGNDDLAIFHLADELCANDVERAGLGGKHPGVAQAAEHEWPDPEWIARAHQLFVG